MTARNVRAYQTRGLIPPPIRDGRRSWYGLQHLTLLQAIQRARARGASLHLIADHLGRGLQLDEDVAPTVTLSGGPGRPGPRKDVTTLLNRMGANRRGADDAPPGGASSRPPVPELVERLVAAGVFDRRGSRIRAPLLLAGEMERAAAAGLTVEEVLTLMVELAQIAVAARAAIDRCLTGAATSSAELRPRLTTLAGSVHLQQLASPAAC